MYGEDDLLRGAVRRARQTEAWFTHTAQIKGGGTVVGVATEANTERADRGRLRRGAPGELEPTKS